MKKQILFGLLAAGMLAACSSDDSLSENQVNQYHMVEGQPAFLNIGIAMPSDPQTRANDDFDDGVAAEYSVKNGKLVLFKGETEATAKLFWSGDIPTLTWTADGSDQITTTSAKYVQEITSPNLSATEKLYAYVILNYKQDGDVCPGIAFTAGTEFATFSKLVAKAIGIQTEAKGYGAEDTDKGFVMTSVPVSSTAGSATYAGEVTALTPIEATAVYETYDAANTATNSACIYVERAAAKVDVTFNSITDPAGTGATVTLDGWCLGNTNNNASGYYNVRQVDPTWGALTNKVNGSYRFISASKIVPTLPGGLHKDGYRTYFGEDVNYYKGNVVGSTFESGLVNKKVLPGDHTLASGDCTYTYENTFDENSQIFANTTYVSFKTVINGGTTFYTIEGAENTVLNQTNVKNQLATLIDNDIHAAIETIRLKIIDAINADLALTTPTIGAGVTEVTFKLKHNVTFGTRNTADGSMPYTDKLGLAEVKVDGADATTAQLAAINALIYESTTTIADKLDEVLTGYTAKTVYEYTNGVTYYTTRIAHFGEAETPWTTGPESLNDYAKIYPTDGQSVNETPSIDYGSSRKAAWLGRWGVVRNNWYQLTVTNITGIGDAEPLDYSGTGTGKPGGTPDDNPEPKYYVSAHIHILPWVKRAQDVILK